MDTVPVFSHSLVGTILPSEWG